ncbi:hypothetical protein Deide_1p01905 (plasmid) [Deinococcus deserti VCD115]|uniref:Uncharacterized protein n=2 Tax=Deinococcus TaxID=1298 RepID=X5HN84_DEIDV|nr:hypothetical protein Deide_1p01905 [Deinococcus deserti VCD115]
MSDRQPPNKSSAHGNTASFRCETGPETLFDRVRFKMAGARRLKFYSAQFRRRLVEEGVPMEELQQFDPEHWDLIAADVRTDTGKFINSTWVCSADQRRWRVVIGFKDTIERVTGLEKDAPTPDAVTSGTLYKKVAKVNGELMDAEA